MSGCDYAVCYVIVQTCLSSQSLDTQSIILRIDVFLLLFL